MDFIIIANAWSAGKDNPTSKHRIALELVRQGHRVLWVEGSGMRTPSVGSSHDRLRMVRKIAAALRGVRREIPDLGSESFRLWILAPLFVPLPRYEFIRRLNGVICRWSTRFWGGRLGFKDPVLINYVPVLAEAMKKQGYRLLVNGCRWNRSADFPATNNQKRITNNLPRAPRVVYHCVDRWDAFSMYDSAMMGEMDRRCCRYADIVIASAGELYERCKAINPNTVLIPHGVDWEHFHQAVEEVQTSDCGKEKSIEQTTAKLATAENCISAEGGESKPSSRASVQYSPGVNVNTASTIGFFGLLSEWVDQELILWLAKEFPSATIQLIGKADVDVTRLQGVANINLMGPKPFAELPSHIATFTVGIIPFVVNDLTRSVNPIKLREMLSAGCPVVSTALPEVALYGNHAKSPEGEKREREAPSVQIAHTHDEFVAMVRRVVEHPLSAEERKALSDGMAGETWSAKVREILQLVRVERRD